MKIANLVRLVILFVLLAPLAVQGENVPLTAEGQVPGMPFQGLQKQIDVLQQQVAALQAQLAAFSLNENGDLVISGVNVYIQDGEGSTDCGGPFSDHGCIGKGNLIVGYDRDVNEDFKTGDHNLVIGDGHTYTGYGGFVAGRNNEISSGWASVSGGRDNVASGGFSSVSGGRGNTASGRHSSVSGGGGNVASGPGASVGGGGDNVASGEDASIGGGHLNMATEGWSSVNGGLFNLASGNSSSVSGGNSNTAAGYNSTVGGGYGRFIDPYSYDLWVAGFLY